MMDVYFASVVVAFALASWGMVAVCDRLMDQHR